MQASSLPSPSDPHPIDTTCTRVDPPGVDAAGRGAAKGLVRPAHGERHVATGAWELSSETGSGERRAKGMEPDRGTMDILSLLLKRPGST